MKHTLSETWIKASIAGTIWAASEIVLGSFLHNLKIPFSGNILTAIGLVILISISYKWNEKGLFWRAGLICALMKTMSPSAVIFGPMIGIFAESVLLETSTRLLGRNIAGYAVGSMLAMSWNLFQKIANYIIFYGSTIIEVYSNLLKMAQKQLNIQTDIVWLPIIILLVVYALFGLMAAIIGIRVGRKMLKDGFIREEAQLYEPVREVFHNNKAQEFSYSVKWLVADILLLIISFLLLVYTKWFIWAPLTTCVILIWALRYKRALRQLSKPKFWVLFVLITLATALVLTKTNEGENFFIAGLMTGIQMNFRAILIIVGFSALGTELYNPVVRSFFMRTSFRNLPLAMELSAESLPAFIAAIPDFRTLRKNPVSIFYKVISHAEMRFSEIQEVRNNAKVYIITGGRAEGKTTWAKTLASRLADKGIKTQGILSLRLMINGTTTGYNITDISTQETFPFLVAGDRGTQKIGKFSIIESGLQKGREILLSAASGRENIVIVDEVGKLELDDKGWAPVITALQGKHLTLILVVRDEFTGMVKDKWHLKDYEIIDIKTKSPEELVSKLIKG